MRARSATTGMPEISLPRPSVRGDDDLSYSFDIRISLSVTSSRCSLGISSPTTVLPGMTSTTSTLITDKDRARSRDSAVILLALTPGAGCNSKRVTTGPG